MDSLKPSPEVTRKELANLKEQLAAEESLFEQIRAAYEADFRNTGLFDRLEERYQGHPIFAYDGTCEITLRLEVTQTPAGEEAEEVYYLEIFPVDYMDYDPTNCSPLSAPIAYRFRDEVWPSEGFDRSDALQVAAVIGGLKELQGSDILSHLCRALDTILPFGGHVRN